MPTVTYTFTGSLQSTTTQPVPPSGFALHQLTQAEMQAYVDAMDGRSETVSGATQTDRMRKLVTAVSAYLAGLQDYSGPTKVLMENCDLADQAAWVPTTDVVSHARYDTSTPVQICVGRNGAVWYVAVVHAPEP
ncbi:MAG: hypothetical protein HZA53_08710 [Planctomycetes bacterium]|nr:hypothetical protein [Planctomycetota bacterium]